MVGLRARRPDRAWQFPFMYVVLGDDKAVIIDTGCGGGGGRGSAAWGACVTGVRPCTDLREYVDAQINRAKLPVLVICTHVHFDVRRAAGGGAMRDARPRRSTSGATTGSCNTLALAIAYCMCLCGAGLRGRIAVGAWVSAWARGTSDTQTTCRSCLSRPRTAPSFRCAMLRASVVCRLCHAWTSVVCLQIVPCLGVCCV